MPLIGPPATTARITVHSLVQCFEVRVGHDGPVARIAVPPGIVAIELFVPNDEQAKQGMQPAITLLGA